MSRVVAIWRYPLKSAHGERLHQTTVAADGLRGDRAWGCIDGADGTVGSAKHPRRWGRLLGVKATASEREPGDEVPVTVHVPGHRPCRAGTSEADAALSAYLGRAVRLSRSVPDGARLHRLLPDDPGLVPEWYDDATPGAEQVTAITGARPGGRFVDFGAVHLVTTGALAGLARRLGRFDVAAVRFRPNLVLDALTDPIPGEELLVGDAVLRVLTPTPRCVVPGLDHGSAPADRALLTALAGQPRAQVLARGRAACFGTYAQVVRTGTVRVGQAVRAS